MSHEADGRGQIFDHPFELTVASAAVERHARDLVQRARPIGPSDRILDLGCQTGIIACVLRDRLGGAAKIVGLDANPAAIEKARSLAPQIDWRVGDITALPFAADSFDLVFCEDVLRLMPRTKGALREVRRVLSPGGRLLASISRATDEALIQMAGSSGEEYRGATKETPWSIDGATLDQALADAGFVDIRIETVRAPDRIAHVALALAPRPA
jgi:SAM-dependent methyltransferase